MKNKGIYILEKLDRLHLADTSTSDKLKKFHLQQQLYLDYSSDLDFEKLPNFDKFFLKNDDSNFFEVYDDISNR